MLGQKSLEHFSSVFLVETMEQFFCVGLGWICFLSCLNSCLQTYVLSIFVAYLENMNFNKLAKGKTWLFHVSFHIRISFGKDMDLSNP